MREEEDETCPNSSLSLPRRMYVLVIVYNYATVCILIPCRDVSILVIYCTYWLVYECVWYVCICMVRSYSGCVPPVPPYFFHKNFLKK